MARVELDYKEHVKSIDDTGKYLTVKIRYIVFDTEKADIALNAVFGRSFIC